jgi:hypothetical protein
MKKKMAKEQQEYPEIELRIDRDSEGNIVQLDYKINDAGQDRKNVVEFIEMLSLLCHNTEETKRIAEEMNKENE